MIDHDGAKITVPFNLSVYQLNVPTPAELPPRPVYPGGLDLSEFSNLLL